MGKPAKDIGKLLDEVDAMVSLYVGKNAEGEPWADTCERIARMGKLAKKIRKSAALSPTEAENG